MVKQEGVALWLRIRLSSLRIDCAILMPFPAFKQRYMLGTGSEVVLGTLAIITRVGADICDFALPVIQYMRFSTHVSFLIASLLITTPLH